MLGLPSTTEVNTRIPKEAFYKKLKMKKAVREQFVNDIERISVCNSIKESTTGIPAGKSIKEILVLKVDLKKRCQPKEALQLIAAQNAHKLLFVCIFEDECFMAVKFKELVASDWTQLQSVQINLNSGSIDSAWDSIASQVVYGDTGIKEVTVEQRYADDAKLYAMNIELEKLEHKRKKEKQYAKKNEMFEQAQELKCKIADLMKGR